MQFNEKRDVLYSKRANVFPIFRRECYPCDNHVARLDGYSRSMGLARLNFSESLLNVS